MSYVHAAYLSSSFLAKLTFYKLIKDSLKVLLTGNLIKSLYISSNLSTGEVLNKPKIRSKYS